MGERSGPVLHLPKSRSIDIEFENIVCSVSNGKSGKKELLKGVSGKFRSGELTAIMGPSGAGKTTLLNILTGFRCSDVQGTIKSNGSMQNKQGAAQYKKECCYILQDDHLAPHFTVSELMTMASDLKLGGGLSDKAKQMLIFDILESLGLTVCKETRCQKLSGGQKKRLSVALELLDNPPVMFLDEPTTGLDSSASLQLISILKAMAKGGRNIICTIHQPSATIYEMFDHVYVLAEGKCVYQGASSNTVAFMTNVGLYCPQYHNPADFLLEVMNGDYGNYTDLLAKATQEKCWRNIPSTAKSQIEEIRNETVESNTISYSMQPPSEWVKFWILLNRSLLQLYRDWTISHLKVFMHMVVGIFLGFTYYRAGNDGSKTISNVGFFLVTSVYLCYTSLMPSVLKFPSEIAVLKKERFNNWYRLKTYYAAFLVADIPTQILFSIVYTAISYLISAQPRDWDRFLMFLWICILVTLTSSSYGLVLGTTVNPVNGTFLGAIGVAVMLVVAGFLILFNHMTPIMYSLSYISYLSYAVEGLVQSVYGYDRAPIPCPDEVEYCHYKIPDVMLRDLGMEKQNYWFDVTFLCVNFVVLRIIAFCTLKRKLATS